MSDGRRVAPFWADGLLCPHCGRPLRWLGEWHGPRFVRKPMEVLVGRRISTADEPERVPVGQSGLEVRTELRFRHVVSLECVPCCKLYSEDQARRGTLPDDKYPASYFVVGHQQSLGTAKPVQNDVPQRWQE